MDTYRLTIAGYYCLQDETLCRAEIRSEHAAADARTALGMTIEEFDLDRDQLRVSEAVACAADVDEAGLLMLAGSAVVLGNGPCVGFVIEAIEVFPRIEPFELN